MALHQGLHRSAAPPTWVDDDGRAYPTSNPPRRQKWRSPALYALRAFVFRRDHFACQHCGVTPPSIPNPYDGRTCLWITAEPRNLLVVDHILAVRLGGTSHPDNLQALCERCNARKSGYEANEAYRRNRREARD